MALEFDGSTQEVISPINGVSGLDVDVKSWSGWVYVDTEPTGAEVLFMTCIDDSASASKRQAMAINAPSVSGFRFHFTQDFDSVDPEWYSDNDFSLNTWYHWSVKYDRSSSANNPTLYVNGSAEGMTGSPGPTGSAVTGDDTMKLGHNPNGGTLWFNGILAEITGWNVALDVDEMIALSSGISPALVRSDSLIWYSPCPGNSGSGTASHGVTFASTLNQSSYTTSNFTPSDGDLLVAFTSAVATVGTQSMSDSLGGTWDKITEVAWAGAGSTIAVFVRDALSDGSALNVTLDCGGDAAVGAIIFVARIAGLKQAGGSMVRQYATEVDGSASTTPAPSFSKSALTNNPTLGLVINQSNPAGMTAPTGWTEQADTGHGTPDHGGEYVTRDSGFTGTTITWGSTSASQFTAIIIEINAIDPISELTQGLLLETYADPAEHSPYTMPLLSFKDKPPYEVSAVSALEVNISPDNLDSYAQGVKIYTP